MIEYLTKVEIGKFYKVPCVKTKHGTYPVIPFKHADPQLGTKAGAMQHYHVDGRFLSPKEARKIHTSESVLDEFERARIADFRVAAVLITDLSEIFFKRLKCLRLFSGQVPSPKVAQGGIASNTFKWYKNQIGKSCKGRICPHYGIEMQVNGRGFLECMLHGLIADEKTEKIIGNIHFNPEMI